MGICARGRFSACAWPCWALPGLASPTRAARTASVWSPMSKSTAAPPTPSHSSPAAGWASALSSFATGARWPRPLSISSRAARFASWLSKTRANWRQLYPHVETNEAPADARLSRIADAQLFREQWVRVTIDPADLPGRSGDRVVCQRCGEGVNFGRFSLVNGESLCLTCARPELRYWNPSAPDE
jgi:hypothetical protein